MLKTLLVLSALLFLPKLSWAQPQEAHKEMKPYGESFTVYIDNDSRNIGGPNADQGYTNGIRFSYVYGEDDIPGWVDNLPWSSRIQKKFDNSKSNYGISLAQQIYTPNDTAREDLISNDRPYAAYLYLGLTAAFKTASHHHLLELDLGVIGPAAMGEAVQNGFHDVIDVPHAKGWNNQLKNEPTLQLSYTQKIRFFELSSKNQGRYFDVIPQAGANFGNVLIGAHTGAMARFGLRLPDDFGPSSFASAGGDSVRDLNIAGKDFSWRAYGFAGIRGKLVLQNIFLDGNTFQPSHSVTKYPFVAETEIGYAVQVSSVSFSWRFVTLSPEFEQYSEVDSYASVAISYLRNF